MLGGLTRNDYAESAGVPRRISEKIVRGNGIRHSSLATDMDGRGRPRNAVSGRPYHGVNTLNLALQSGVLGHPNDPRWCTVRP